MTRSFAVSAFTVFILFVYICFAGCKREHTDSPTPPNPPENPVVVDDAVQVTATVSGIVLDENNSPVAGAIVASANTSVITNSFGAFTFSNISLSKENGSVTVTKPGYFKGVRSFKTTAGKHHMVKIQLMQKLLSGTITSGNGGTINSNGGASVNFPANAFTYKNGAAYAGTVNVYSRWIDPTANNLPFIIPGDLRGVTTAGAESMLETYGMVGAEIEDLSGNSLKMAAGKTATITFPLPAALQASAPDSIALWHFDDATARWKEEGTATKSGMAYSASVDKFSFWNADIAREGYVLLDYTLVTGPKKIPLTGVVTRIKAPGPNSYGYGMTNHEGFVSGMVFKDVPLILEVMTASCPMPVFTKEIGPFSSNTSLGDIEVTIGYNQQITFTGKLVNCDAAAVVNGSVSLYGAGGNTGFGATDESGNFSFSVVNCSGASLPYSFMGTDNATRQESAVATGIAAGTTADLGTIKACGASSGVSIYVAGNQDGLQSIDMATVWKDGVATVLTDGLKASVANDVYVSGNDVYATGTERTYGTNLETCRVWKNGAVLYTLTDGTTIAQANAIVVSGNDVYVGGSIVGAATVWKNGVPVTLDHSSSSHAKDIAVVGTDVYATGFDNLNGVVWKNGHIIYTMNSLDLRSVFISGMDIYVAGAMHDGTAMTATVWKNGVPTLLHAGPRESRANSVFVSGGDVYVAGNATINSSFVTAAKIWKNGVATDLTNGARYGSAASVTVVGNDVYVAGNDQEEGKEQMIRVWKNGLPLNITDGIVRAYPTSMFVK